MPATLFQTLAVSALVAINESMVESGRLSRDEERMFRRVIASIRDAFDAPAPAPILILATDDVEYDGTLDRIGETMGAAE